MMKAKKLFGNLLIAVTGGLIVLAGNWIFSEQTEDAFGKQTTKQQTLIQHPNHQVEIPSKFASLKTDIDFTAAAENSVNAVVHVKTTYQREAYESPILDFFFGYKSYTPPPVEGFGSGVIISKDGYIVTNNHVVEKSDFIEVVLNDKRTLKAKLIGTDPTTDVALLKVEGDDFPTITYGNSDNLKIGQWVLAVGNPFNLTSTVTAGIISAKARHINILDKQSAIESFIQTDAAVNPGNSGGALVSTEGKLVGINTAIASQTGYFTGYSFAIPVNMVKKIVADIIEYGEVQRAYLGVNITDIDSKLAEQLGIEELKGAYISSLTSQGAAEEAGLRKADIITKVAEVRISKVAELQEQLSMFRPGDEVKITVLRGKKEMDYKVTLRNKYGSTKIVRSSSMTALGARFEQVSKEEKSRLRINYGLKVSELSAGKLLKAGVQEGFIILKMNRQPVKSVEDLEKFVKGAKGGVYMEGIYPNGIMAYYAFGLK